MQQRPKRRRIAGNSLLVTVGKKRRAGIKQEDQIRKFFLP